MMDRDRAWALLEDLDDPVRAEAPPRWDRRAAEAIFVALAQALEQRLGYQCAYETGSSIQDASFHGQLRLPRELLMDEYIVQLRASNFGHLATIYDDDIVVKQDARATIVSTLEEFGYIYIPSDVLNTPYTGRNPGVSGSRTWGERFFDWI